MVLQGKGRTRGTPSGAMTAKALEWTFRWTARRRMAPARAQHMPTNAVHRRTGTIDVARAGGAVA